MGTPQTHVRLITDSQGRNHYPAAMSHAYAHNLMHCVFSTKERQHLIRDPESLWRYTVGLAYQKKICVISAGGTTNHAHLLVLVPQTLPLAKVMQEIKANTSRWLRESSRAFQWQAGYGAFSVSQSQRDVVAQYIANQPEHHRKRSFEEEFVALLQKSGIDYDPRYVFG